MDPHGGGLFYVNKAAFFFSRYLTLLHQAYTTIGRLQTDPGDQAKVHRLVSGMNVPNSVEVTIAKSHVLDNDLADWPGAVNYLATKVAQAFPVVTKKRKHGGPSRRISEARRGRGRGYGRGGRRGGGGGGGRGGGAFFGGVDCTDFKKNFSPGQIKQMGEEGLAYIRRKRYEAKMKAKAKGGGGGGGRGYQGRGGHQGRGNDQRSVSQTETEKDGGCAAEEVESGSHRSAQGRGGRAGAGFGRGAYGRGGRGGRW